MRQCTLPFLLAAALLFLLSCGKKADMQDSQTANPSQQETAKKPEQEPVPSAPTTADNLRAMAADQQVRAQEVQDAVRTLRKARSHDPEQIRQILLTRKGEILSVQKRIRLSDQLTPSQKDSLLKPLEGESVQISTQLLAVSQ